MVVERKNKPSTVFFSFLNLGDCFEYNNHICMKTDTLKEHDTEYNAVYVENGKFVFVSAYENVVLLSMKLVEV